MSILWSFSSKIKLNLSVLFGPVSLQSSHLRIQNILTAFLIDVHSNSTLSCGLLVCDSRQTDLVNTSGHYNGILFAYISCKAFYAKTVSCFCSDVYINLHIYWGTKLEVRAMSKTSDCFIYLFLGGLFVFFAQRSTKHLT